MNAVTSVPILVLGEKRRLELVERLRGRVQAWLRTWSASANERRIAVEMAEISAENSDLLRDGSKIIVGSIDGVAHLALVSNRNLLGSILGLPRGVSSESPSSKVCGPIRDEVLMELARAVTTNVQTGAWLIAQLESRTAREAMADQFHRGWAASISIDGAELVKILLSANAVSWLQPSDTKVAGAALSRRRAAIGEETIQVQAVLGEATVSIGELAQLAVDDVIVLGADISQPGALITSAGLRVANFSPGRVGTKRAALLVR